MLMTKARETERVFSLNPIEMSGRLALDGLERADYCSLVDAYERLGGLIGEPRCSLATLWLTHCVTDTAVWLAYDGDEATGAWLVVALSEEGATAAEAGAFDALRPAHHQLCRPGDRVHAYYGWVFAGSTAMARFRVLRAAKRFCDGEFGEVPCYARAATVQGAVALAKLGFTPRADDPSSYRRIAGKWQ